MRGKCAECGQSEVAAYEINSRGSYVCKDCNQRHGGFQPGWTPLVWLNAPERQLEDVSG